MKIQNISRIKLKLSLFNYENLETEDRLKLLEKMLNLNLKMYEENYPNIDKIDFNNLQTYYSKISFELISMIDHLIMDKEINISSIHKFKGIVQILKVDIYDKLKDIKEMKSISPFLKNNLKNIFEIIKNENFDSLQSLLFLFTTRNYLGDFQDKNKHFISGLAMESSSKNLAIFRNNFESLKGYTNGWLMENLDYELLSQKSKGITNHLDYMEWFKDPKTKLLMSMDIEVKIEDKIHLIDAKNYLVSSKNGLKLSFHHSLDKMPKELNKNYFYNKNSSYMYTFMDEKENKTNSYLIPFKIMKEFIKKSIKDPTIFTSRNVIKISNNKFKDIFKAFEIDFEKLNLNDFFDKKPNYENEIERSF